MMMAICTVSSGGQTMSPPRIGGDLALDQLALGGGVIRRGTADQGEREGHEERAKRTRK